MTFKVAYYETEGIHLTGKTKDFTTFEEFERWRVERENKISHCYAGMKKPLLRAMKEMAHLRKRALKHFGIK